MLPLVTKIWPKFQVGHQKPNYSNLYELLFVYNLVIVTQTFKWTIPQPFQDGLIFSQVSLTTRVLCSIASEIWQIMAKLQMK